MRRMSARGLGVCRHALLAGAACGVLVPAAANGQPTNDECATAILLDCGTVTVANNIGATSNVTDPGYSCNIGSPGGQGVSSLWYRFVASATSARLLTCTSPSSAVDALLAVYDGACGSLVEIACSDDVCGLTGSQADLCVAGLTIGNEYIVQLASYSSGDQGPYNLILECPCPGPCDLVCDPGKTPENEPDCGLPSDTVNGGCFTFPNVFSAITCDESICGSLGADSAIRDQDWYRLVLTDNAEVTWAVTTEVAAVIGIVNTGGVDSCGSISGFLALAVTNACMESSVQATLSAGTWYLYVSTAGLNIPCGAEYNATVSCGPVHFNFDFPGSDPLDPIEDPTGAWHEVVPNFCNDWTCDEWIDNGSGVLDPCDYLHMVKDSNGDMEWVHVENVTITLICSAKPKPSVFYYLDYLGTDILGAMMNPVGSPWVELNPSVGTELMCIGFNDNGDGLISPCDQIIVQNPVTGEVREFHVDAVATDIDVVEEDPPPPPCPGDCGSPMDGFVDITDLLALLAQWGGTGSCDIANIPGEVEVGDLLELLAEWGVCP